MHCICISHCIVIPLYLACFCSANCIHSISTVRMHDPCNFLCKKNKKKEKNKRKSLSQLALRRGGNMGLDGASSKEGKMHRVATNVYSRKMSGKPKLEKVEGLRILKMRVWELFMHREGISTSRARHKGQQPLIECANHDFNFIYFPFYLYFSFYIFFYLFWLFMFFTFLGSTSMFPSLLCIPQL